MEQEYKYMVVTRCFTFNHAPYIVDAMNGFTMQETTFPVITLIVDDASTDGEPGVIKKYLADNFQTPYRTEETDDYNLICAKHNTNLNCTFVVFLLKYNHYSMKKPKLPYLAEWLDYAKYHALCEGDDYWTDPSKLQKQIDLLECNSHQVLCFTDVVYYYESTKKFGDRQSKVFGKSNKNLPENSEKLFYHILLGKCRIQFLTVVYRNYVDSLEGIPNFMMGDTPLWLRLSQKGSFCFLPDCTGVYRINRGSASNNPSTKLLFHISMAEMRCFYCEFYGYEVPNGIKQAYNRSLCQYILTSGMDLDKQRPLLPMNVIQTWFFQYSVRHKSILQILEFIWHIEILLYNFRVRHYIYSQLR